MEQLTENQATAETETTDFSRKFNLKFGYQDEENPEIIHREVVIGRRPVVADLLKAVESNSISFEAKKKAWLEKLSAEVDLIIREFGWSEHEILSLPDMRRESYVSLILARHKRLIRID